MNNEVNRRTPLAPKKISQIADNDGGIETYSGVRKGGKDRAHKLKSQEALCHNQPPSLKSLQSTASPASPLTRTTSAGYQSQRTTTKPTSTVGTIFNQLGVSAFQTTASPSGVSGVFNATLQMTRQRYTDKNADYEPPRKQTAMDEGRQMNFGSNLPSEQCGNQKYKSKSKQKCLAKSCSYTVTSRRVTEFGHGHGLGLEKLQTEKTSNVSPVVPPPATLAFSYHQLTMTPMRNANITAAGTAVAATHPATKHANAAAVAASTTSQRQQILNWTVADVCAFIKNLPCYADYVGKFAQHEIDGEALLLLKAEHLIEVMGMKSRPASKLVAKIKSMKKINDAGDVKSSCNNNK